MKRTVLQLIKLLVVIMTIMLIQTYTVFAHTNLGPVQHNHVQTKQVKILSVLHGHLLAPRPPRPSISYSNGGSANRGSDRVTFTDTLYILLTNGKPTLIWGVCSVSTNNSASILLNCLVENDDVPSVDWVAGAGIRDGKSYAQESPGFLPGVPGTAWRCAMYSSVIFDASGNNITTPYYNNWAYSAYYTQPL